jgi:hypothetical protein
MFIDEHFIQRKFIVGRGGKRFSYKDTIIMNVFNLSQAITIQPEKDMVLKVRVHESDGVNANMSLSSQVG